MYSLWPEDKRNAFYSFAFFVLLLNENLRNVREHASFSRRTFYAPFPYSAVCYVSHKYMNMRVDVILYKLANYLISWKEKWIVLIGPETSFNRNALSIYRLSKPKSMKRPHLLMCVSVCAPRAHNIGVLVKRLATFETKASKKQAMFNAKTGFSNVTLQFLHVFHSAGFFFVSISLIIFSFYVSFYFQIESKFWIICNPRIDIREFCGFFSSLTFG